MPRQRVQLVRQGGIPKQMLSRLLNLVFSKYGVLFLSLVLIARPDLFEALGSVIFGLFVGNNQHEAIADDPEVLSPIIEYGGASFQVWDSNLGEHALVNKSMRDMLYAMSLQKAVEFVTQLTNGDNGVSYIAAKRFCMGIVSETDRKLSASVSYLFPSEGIVFNAERTFYQLKKDVEVFALLVIHIMIEGLPRKFRVLVRHMGGELCKIGGEAIPLVVVETLANYHEQRRGNAPGSPGTPRIFQDNLPKKGADDKADKETKVPKNPQPPTAKDNNIAVDARQNDGARLADMLQEGGRSPLILAQPADRQVDSDDDDDIIEELADMRPEQTSLTDWQQRKQLLKRQEQRLR